MNGTLFWAYALVVLLELRESELRCSYYYRERKRSTLVIAAIVPVEKPLSLEKLSPRSSAEAVLCRSRGETGRKKNKAHGARFFLLPTVPRALSFFDCCYFYWDNQREPLRRREA